MNKDDKSDSLGVYFVGEYERSIDKQRRVAIPCNWRGENSTRFFLLPGRNATIQIIPFEFFQTFLNKIRKVSFANAKATLALAQIGSNAHECTCDKQGRIQVPQRLFEYTGIKSSDEQLVLVGAFTSIHMLSLNNWKEQQVDSEICLDQIQKIEESKNDDFFNILQNLGE